MDDVTYFGKYLSNIRIELWNKKVFQYKSNYFVNVFK